jgi:hypothetical protein
VIASSPSEFADAVGRHRLDPIGLDPSVAAGIRTALHDEGLLLLGEPHGVYETAAVVYSLAIAFDIRAVAFEWSHEEMDREVQAFVRNGVFAFDLLWSLPASAEFFCGDGRITAGHFALLQRLRDEGRLDQVLVFDRLDPEPPANDWRARERELAERLLAEWDDRSQLLVLTGAFHARLDADDGDTMAMHVARRRPRLATAMLDYAGGRCWSRGLHDLSEPMPPAPIRLRLSPATPAVVPGPATGLPGHGQVPETWLD